jgi:hypothetical protein
MGGKEIGLKPGNDPNAGSGGKPGMLRLCLGGRGGGRA